MNSRPLETGRATHELQARHPCRAVNPHARNPGFAFQEKAQSTKLIRNPVFVQLMTPYCSKLLTITLACIVLSHFPANYLHAEVQTGRYTTVQPLPTVSQARVLATVVSIRFPNEVKNVGQAIRHLIEPYGYRLSRAKPNDPTRAILLELRLPKVHRQLGPISIQHLLETLAGPSWMLVEDPVQRLISFERCLTMQGEERNS